jgi:hypothetical protein
VPGSTISREISRLRRIRRAARQGKHFRCCRVRQGNGRELPRSGRERSDKARHEPQAKDEKQYEHGAPITHGYGNFADDEISLSGNQGASDRPAALVAHPCSSGFIGSISGIANSYDDKAAPLGMPMPA